MNAADPNTVEAWRESVGRVDAFSQIADKGNFALNGPIHVNLPQQDLVFEVAWALERMLETTSGRRRASPEVL